MNANNTGTIDVQNGTLNLTGSLTSSGLLNVAGGAGVVVAGGNQIFTTGATLNAAAGASVIYLSGGLTFSPGVTMTGAGNNRVTGGVSFNGTVNLPNFEVAGGMIYGDFTNTGTLNWTSGTLAGRMVIGATGVLNLTGNADKNLDANQGAKLVNAGVVNWTGGNLVSQMPCGFGSFPVALSNLVGGVFNIQTDTAIMSSGCSFWNISNAGLLRKIGSNGTNVWSGGVNANNTGTIDVQNGTLNLASGLTQLSGTTRLSGGFLNGGTFNLNGGMLSGSGVINASVINGAVISPGSSPGTLTINGNYTQTATGVVQMELGGLTPGSEFDRLVVNGQATLAGDLNVTLINGFRPTSGDSFAVMSFTSRSGSFTTTNRFALGNGLYLTANFTATMLTLTATGSIVTPPVLAYSRSAEGVFWVKLSGQPNVNYRLDGSTNLVDWVILVTTNSPSGLLDFNDPQSATIPHRFYRAVTP